MSDEQFQKILDAWPNCAIQGCPNKCYKAKNSIYCWPHTGTGKSPEDLITEINDNANIGLWEFT